MFFLCYHSYGYIETLYGRGRILPALGLPIWWIYVWAPVGFAITGIQYFLTAIKNLTSKDVYLSTGVRSEEHTSELQSRPHLVCRLLLEKKKKKLNTNNKLHTHYATA